MTLALEDGTHPLICEGTARLVAAPWTEEIKAAFNKKYEWDLDTESQYNEVIEVTPEKWLLVYSCGKRAIAYTIRNLWRDQ